MIRIVTRSKLEQRKDKATGETRYSRKCWFALSFDYNTSTIASLKKQRAWWSPQDKTWCMPFTAGSKAWIENRRCNISYEAQVILDGLCDKDERIKQAIKKHYPLGPPRLISKKDIDGKMWLVDLNQRLLEKELQ